MKRLIFCLAMLVLSAGAHAQEAAAPDINDSINNSYAGNKTKRNNRNRNTDEEGDVVRVKNMSKTFAADRTDKISLSNQFGSMVIKVWDRKEVKVDIAISVTGNNEKNVQEQIDQVEIKAEKNGDLISCRTEIDREDNNRWSGRNKKNEIKVNYVAYVPASNALTLSQQFGSMNIGDFSGALSAKVQYGNLVAGRLSGDNNYISVQYGKTNIQELNKATIKQQYGAGLTIGSVGDLNLTAQYTAVDITAIRGNAVIKQQYGSGLSIGTVNDLDLNAQYAGVEITAIKGDATIRQQYGQGLKIGTVGKLMLRTQYASVTIGTLRGDGDFSLGYNGLNIAEVGNGCKNLNISASYSDLNLGFANGYNADFTLEKGYGNFKYGSGVKARLTNDEDDHSSTKNYVGKIGNGGSATVRIKASYGSVIFK